MTETTYETLSYSEQYYRAKLEKSERSDFAMFIFSVVVCFALVLFVFGGLLTALYDRLKNKR